MKFVKKFVVQPICLLMFFLVASSDTTAQKLKQKHLVNEREAMSRKSETNVVLVNTGVLNELMVKCMGMGIENISLVFTRIRKADIANYIINHPEAIGYENELIGKMTVLIKVEGNDLSPSGFVTDATSNQMNSLVQKMNSAGLLTVNRPYGNVPAGTIVLYFEVGSICPPPNSCN